MLSAVATVYSQCIFDAQFSYRLKYPDNIFVVWRLNSVYIKASNNIFKMHNSNNTYTLYIPSVRRYMAGIVCCELRERLTSTSSRVLQTQKGKLTVLHREWFENTPKNSIIYQFDGAVALIPYVFGDECGAVSRIRIENNKLLMYFISEPFVDENIDTFLALFVYKCERNLIYVKIVYDPTVFSHHTLRIKLTTQTTCFPISVKNNLKVNWEFSQNSANCFTYEVTDQGGAFPNISPLPTCQVSKRPELTLVDPPRNKLIAVRIRTAKPLPGQPAPDFKHVVLRSAPVQAPATGPTPGPSNRH